jgi:hypothetical protein
MRDARAAVVVDRWRGAPADVERIAVALLLAPLVEVCQVRPVHFPNHMEFSKSVASRSIPSETCEYRSSVMAIVE